MRVDDVLKEHGVGNRKGINSNPEKEIVFSWSNFTAGSAGTIVVANTQYVAVSGTNYIDVYDYKTKQKITTINLDGYEIVGSIPVALLNDKLFVSVSIYEGNFKIFVYNILTGERVKTLYLNNSQKCEYIRAIDNYVYATGTSNGLSKFDENGEVIWSNVEIGERTYIIDSDLEGNLYVGATIRRRVFKITTDGTAISKSYNSNGNVTDGFITTDGYLFAMSDIGLLKISTETLDIVSRYAEVAYAKYLEKYNTILVICKDGDYNLGLSYIIDTNFNIKASMTFPPTHLGRTYYSNDKIILCAVSPGWTGNGNLTPFDGILNIYL